MKKRENKWELSCAKLRSILLCLILFTFLHSSISQQQHTHCFDIQWLNTKLNDFIVLFCGLEISQTTHPSPAFVSISQVFRFFMASLSVHMHRENLFICKLIVKDFRVKYTSYLGWN